MKRSHMHLNLGAKETSYEAFIRMVPKEDTVIDQESRELYSPKKSKKEVH